MLHCAIQAQQLHVATVHLFTWVVTPSGVPFVCVHLCMVSVGGCCIKAKSCKVTLLLSTAVLSCFLAGQRHAVAWQSAIVTTQHLEAVLHWDFPTLVLDDLHSTTVRE